MYQTVQEHSLLIGYLVAVLHCVLLAILLLLQQNTVIQFEFNTSLKWGAMLMMVDDLLSVGF